MTSPTIEGYTASQTVVSGTMPDDDVTVTVTYTANEHTLTIHYVYAGGGEAAPDYSATVAYGARYSVTSPTIEGYTASQTVVSGTMPDDDVTVTVTYTANEYTVTWKNDNGETLAAETYHYLDMPSYKGATPVKPGDAFYTYHFAGWEPTIVAVTANAVYTAVYEAMPIDPAPAVFDLNTGCNGNAMFFKQLLIEYGTVIERFEVTLAPMGENEAATLPGGRDCLTGVTADMYRNKEIQPFVFSQSLTFTEPGDYYYVVRETNGKTRGMTYDTEPYYLVVSVRLNQNTNALYVEAYHIYRGGMIKAPSTDVGQPDQLVITNKFVEKPFTPVKPSGPSLNTDDHYAYVMGYPDGTVQPNGNITRAEVATIFFRLLTDESRNEYWSSANAYSDVHAGDWYNNAISTLSNAGIVSGYPDGTFRPNAPITRAEMAKIIALFAKLDRSLDSFNDISGHWAEAYIRLAAGNGWIQGYPDGSFRPNRSITRAETMTMINRVLERVPSVEEHLLPYRTMLTFPDCQPGEWYYIAVQEATNSHTYERASGVKNGDEQWIALRANRDWTLLEK